MKKKEISCRIQESDNTNQKLIDLYRYQSQVNYWHRDQYGLLPNIDYIFKENELNKIDWYKMIPKQYLIPNKEKFPLNTDIKSLNVEELDDSKVLILLSGFRYLSNLRGYNYIKQYISQASLDYVAITCEIEIIGNFETDMRPIIFVGEADAHIHNTHNFARNFLTCIAGNRAFVRAWRHALEIPILGQDELGPEHDKKEEANNNEVSLHHPLSLLSQKLREKGKSFSQLKVKLIKENSFNPEIVNGWETEKDIPVPDVIRVLGILS